MLLKKWMSSGICLQTWDSSPRIPVPRSPANVLLERRDSSDAHGAPIATRLWWNGLFSEERRCPPCPRRPVARRVRSEGRLDVLFEQLAKLATRKRHHGHRRIHRNDALQIPLSQRPSGNRCAVAPAIRGPRLSAVLRKSQMRQHDNQLGAMIVVQRRDQHAQLGFARRHLDFPAFVGRQQVCGYDRGKADDADSDPRAVDDGEWLERQRSVAVVMVSRKDGGRAIARRSRAHAPARTPTLSGRSCHPIPGHASARSWPRHASGRPASFRGTYPRCRARTSRDAVRDIHGGR